jgi:hypothetical protein
MRMFHSECGGRVEIDRAKPPIVIGAGSHIVHAIKCVNCGSQLGFLRDVDQGNNPHYSSRIGDSNPRIERSTYE